ncbi:hypothetical protein A0H81_05136 [Grifola frondosa]|uniref:HNH nuclease domain-containing protein n=1 Tax=Grifola frondosa TaxID=5627 RepID=A0A1C7MC38_GRIFR|nr:hypothetical protein A0H81_05136 [Grifola frondosa]
MSSFGCKVCHLVAKNEDSDVEGLWLRMTRLTPDFKRDHKTNLIFLCRGHHAMFDLHIWTLVPALEDIEMLITAEEANFTGRLRLLQNGHWTPRRVPEWNRLSGRFAYLFLKSSALGSNMIGTIQEDYPDTDAGSVVSPQRVIYTDIGDPPAYIRRVVPLTIHHNPFWIELTLNNPNRPTGYWVNPFACICRALTALNTSYTPSKLFWKPLGANQEAPIYSPVEQFEARLLRLRSLYNRELGPVPMIPHRTAHPGPPVRPSGHQHGGYVAPNTVYPGRSIGPNSVESQPEYRQTPHASGSGNTGEVGRAKRLCCGQTRRCISKEGTGIPAVDGERIVRLRWYSRSRSAAGSMGS